MYTKWFAGIFSMVILLTGMNLCWVTHFCDHRLVESVCSIGPTQVGCCGVSSTPSTEPAIEQHDCCTFYHSALIVDSSYQPSFFSLEKVSEFPLPFLGQAVSGGLFTWPFFVSEAAHPPHAPPDSTEVSLDRICVFLI